VEPGQPSRTAFGAALYRAAHQFADHPAVFVDPLALKIVGSEAEARLRTGEERYAEPGSPLRAFLAVRSRFAEEAFLAARARGTSQYVLLGAGLDTFAYRRPQDGALTVFEIDHPSTQAWKRTRLAETGIAIPPRTIHAPVDFESETLEEGLARAGFDAGRSASFAWLGVVPYLTRPAIDATLSFVGRLPRGTEIVFDYAVSRAGRGGLMERAAAVGEPLQTFLDRHALARNLSHMGFSELEDLDSAAINTRYFQGRSDGLQVRGPGHLMRARV
jgi:methyltransferase (TIGR00027 family)